MESWFLLDIVVRKSFIIVKKLITSEDKSLLTRWNTFFVVDLGLHDLNGVRWLDIKGDGSIGEGFDEDDFLNTSVYGKS